MYRMGQLPNFGCILSIAEFVDIKADCSSPSAVTKVLGRKVMADDTEETLDSKLSVARIFSPCLALSDALLVRA